MIWPCCQHANFAMWLPLSVHHDPSTCPSGYARLQLPPPLKPLQIPASLDRPNLSTPHHSPLLSQEDQLIAQSLSTVPYSASLADQL